MSTKFQLRRANGGHLLHACYGYTAVCGYRPSSPNGFLIRGRGRWVNCKDGGLPTCKKCLAKLKQK